eukprot:TRINITY_DN2881_c0_g1_i2.p1 TRINITY_DN2881_c0_g1~~TRINITY_DN2881_c0_g1_i2.p1  ORF type:complete len:320 (-),score=46.19 TRINITY_DN2881_c0_g1_i2:286-1245(-)
MLHRCVASSACCPQLKDEDITGSGPTPQFYSNPFFYEDMSIPAALRLNNDHDDEEDGGEFPPGALALMYDPPIDDDLGSDGDDWGQSISRPPSSKPMVRRNDPLGMQLRGTPTPQNGGYGGVSRAAGDTGIDYPLSPNASLKAARMGPATYSANSQNDNPRPPSINHVGSSGQPRPVGDVHSPGGNLSASSTQYVYSTPQKSGFGPSRPNNSSLSPKVGQAGNRQVQQEEENENIVQPRTQSRTLRAAEMHLDQRQPKSFSRSVREAQACKSEAGQASIAAILQCVAKVEEVPAQQRPNSEKWSERWNGANLQKHVKDK